MRVARLAFLILGLSGGPALAQTELGEPVKLVRTLELLQDQIARGAASSDAARRSLIASIAARFLVMDDATWKDVRNADAALLYVLNGGDPVVLNRLPAAGDAAVRETLRKAIRAYANGSRDEAKALWKEIDLGTVPHGLVGPAALVKANLLMDDDPSAAMQFVDIARLESPGTLIEEAAVRRGIEIAAALKDPGRFEFLSIRYASRFPLSMYASAFRRRFSESYLAVASDDPAAPPALDAILAPLAAHDRRDVYLEVARLAVVQARMALARSAAESAAALSEPGTIEMMRSDLYEAAASAIVDDPGQAMARLEAVKSQAMPPRDAKLLEAALSVVGEIQKWPSDSGKPESGPESGPDAAADQAADGEGGPAETLLLRAKTAIAAADRSLAAAAE